MGKGLLVIDIQNDYFPGGAFPLWNSEGVLENIEQAIKKAKEKNMPVILVQHIADADGKAPFFNKGSEGVKLHPKVLALAPEHIVVKEFADSFFKTSLEKTLSAIGVDELLICGMMTQNCVTHTAISKSAERYKVAVLGDCCTTVSEILHLIALNGLATRVGICSFDTI
jgi:nicotinamidase-related amidase